MTATARRNVGHAVATAAYLVLAIGLWSGIWFGHPTTTATCGCGDTSMFTWALSWPAYAFSHGQSLLFSTRVHPSGLNIPANTTVLALAVPLAPVTRVFGPVAALNTAATLAPVASALGARAVALRWTTWSPAAFVAGLAYGFSPFVLEALALEHVDMATLVVPPLLLLGLDELLMGQRRRPAVVGAALGGLAAVQFFISPEVLVMCALAALIGIAILVLYAVVTDPTSVRERWRHAAVGVAAGAATATVLLSYPAWYALTGPRHLPGKVWPDQQLFGNTWQSILFPAGPHDRGPNAILETYGSFGSHPLLRGFLGITLGAVLLFGLIWFRRNRRLWFLLGMLLIFEGLALGASSWPWRLFDNVPVVENVVPGRLAGVADLFAALALAVVVDGARNAVVDYRRTRSEPVPPDRHRRRVVGAVIGLGLATAALGPIAFYDARPMSVRPVDVPAWFTTVGTHLPESAVVLTYPYPPSGLQAPLTWQATTGLRFAIVGGGVTIPLPAHATATQREDAAAGRDLASLSYGWLPVPDPSLAELVRLRRALTDWGVTTVVVPSEAGTPAALRPRSVPLAVAVFTAVVGTEPRWQADAWVWSLRPTPPGPSPLPAGTVVRCSTSSGASTDPGVASRCVQAARTIAGRAGGLPT